MTGTLIASPCAPNAAYYAVNGVGTVEGRSKHLVKVFRGPDGEFLDSVGSGRSLESGGMGLMIDPLGKVLSVSLDRGKHWTLLDLPSLRMHAVLESELGCVGPGVRRWGRREYLSSNQQALAIFDEGEPQQPLVRIGLERGPISYHFAPDGQSIVWCNSDGTVSVCDLKAVNQRLSEFGLGW